MIELKLFGRGGQGLVTAGKILAETIAIEEDKYAITVPSYGHERRGAPVFTSVLIDEKPILVHSFVYSPDIVGVFDVSLIDMDIGISQGIKSSSILLLNTDDREIISKYASLGFTKIYYGDATKSAMKHIGKEIPNTAMLGMIACTGIYSMSSLKRTIMRSFVNGGDANYNAAKEAYENAKEY